MTTFCSHFRCTMKSHCVRGREGEREERARIMTVKGERGQGGTERDEPGGDKREGER